MRWGILGASNFARKQMAPAIHAARGAQLVALATSDRDKARPFLEIQPQLRVFDDYEALLASETIDAVYIPLPNHLHVPWALKALAAGKHVLCEKPFALRATEFDQLQQAATKARRHCAEAYMIVHHPQWLRARQLLAEGAIGKLRHVDACFTYNNVADTMNIRNDAAMGGGGLRDIGVYTLGATRFATGQEPVSVPFANLELDNGVDVYANTVLEFDGFSLNSLVSMRMQARQFMTFHGEGGVIHLPCPFNPSMQDQAELVLETNGHVRTIERWPDANQYVIQVETFAHVAGGKVEDPCPLAFSRGTQESIEMVFSAGQQT